MQKCIHNPIKKMVPLLLALLYIPAYSFAGTLLRPEISHHVVFSNVDINRLVCSAGKVQDVYFSEEKGVEVVTNENSVMVKFKLKIEGGKESYVKKISEFYVSCGSEIYTIFAEPKSVRGKTYRLGNPDRNRMQENVKLLGALPEEDRAISLLRHAYLDDKVPSSYRVVKPDDYKLEWKELTLNKSWINVSVSSASFDVARRKDIFVDGLGLTLTEWWVRPRQDIEWDERWFLNRYFGEGILLISSDVDEGAQMLLKNGLARVFVINKEALK